MFKTMFKALIHVPECNVI